MRRHRVLRHREGVEQEAHHARIGRSSHFQAGIRASFQRVCLPKTDDLVGVDRMANKIVEEGGGQGPKLNVKEPSINLFSSSIQCDHCISLLPADER
jgi:hypothetical protein